MNKKNVDVVIIGAGPAGLAAALKCSELGIANILVIERAMELGGILQQCVHDGFGIHKFGKRLTGNQYAQRYIDQIADSKVEILLDTMVLELTADKVIYAVNKTDGMLEIHAGAVILAMGCRERTAGQVLLCGERPAGILTAGAVQRYINIEGYLPGKTAVILGSGDIGLIMARRMTLEGIKVKGVYEVMPSPGGLTRNIVQCLEDYDIPLHLATTVTAAHGKDRITGVTVAKVDENKTPIPGTEEEIDCDLLLLAVGLIPENELSRNAGVEMDRRTGGPLLDDRMMTSIPGIFAAGNVAVVFDLVDYVSVSGEAAAEGAAAYLAGKLPVAVGYREVIPGANVNFVVPQRIRIENHDEKAGTVIAEDQAEGQEAADSADVRIAIFFLRVKEPMKKVTLNCIAGEKTVFSKKYKTAAPPEMISFTAPAAGELTVEVKDSGTV